MLEGREKDHLEGKGLHHHLVGRELHLLVDKAFHQMVGMGRGLSYLVGKVELLY